MNDDMNYTDFLKAKVRFDSDRGFPCDPSEVNPWCKPHQRDIVAWAVRGGQRAIFAAFGLGKSVMQLEVLRLTLLKSGGGRGLIVCPLGVRQEFKHDAAKLGRRGRGAELNPAYFSDGVLHLRAEAMKAASPTLFDLEPATAEVEA